MYYEMERILHEWVICHGMPSQAYEGYYVATTDAKTLYDDMYNNRGVNVREVLGELKTFCFSIFPTI